MKMERQRESQNSYLVFVNIHFSIFQSNLLPISSVIIHWCSVFTYLYIPQKKKVEIRNENEKESDFVKKNIFFLFTSFFILVVQKKKFPFFASNISSFSMTVITFNMYHNSYDQQEKFFFLFFFFFFFL